jgi:hypothetical protein
VQNASNLIPAFQCPETELNDGLKNLPKAKYKYEVWRNRLVSTSSTTAYLDLLVVIRKKWRLRRHFFLITTLAFDGVSVVEPVETHFIYPPKT